MNDDQLRDDLETLLRGGLPTESEQRPQTSDERNAIVARLQSVARDDRRGKLAVAGFLDHPYATGEEGIVEACGTCMYYELHRQFCALPELELPVKPEWSCRLWRI